MIDSPLTSWCDPFLQVLLGNRCPTDRLWPFSHLHLTTVFRRSCTALHLQPLQPVLYMLRHGGASHDILMKHRDLLSVKTRGRWRSDTSLLRYQKASRAQSSISVIPAAVVALGKFVETNMEACFMSPDILETAVAAALK